MEFIVGSTTTIVTNQEELLCAYANSIHIENKCKGCNNEHLCSTKYVLIDNLPLCYRRKEVNENGKEGQSANNDGFAP